MPGISKSADRPILNRIKAIFDKVRWIIDKYPKLTLTVTLVICACIIVARRPETIIGAQFWAEDGKYWFADAYNNGFSVLTQTYGGYFVVVYRVVAFFSLLLPFHFVPAFFNIIGLLFQLLPVLLFCSGRLPFARKHWVGILLSLIYVCVPNSGEVFSNLTNIQWHLGVAAFLVLITAESRRLFWRVFDYAVIILTGLAGPLTILLTPIAFLIWRLNIRSENQRNKLILLIVMSLIQMIGILFFSTDKRFSAHVIGNFYDLLKMLTGQIITGGLWGQAHVTFLYSIPILLLIAFLLGITLCVYGFIKGPWWLRYAMIFSVFIVCSMLFSLKALAGVDIWQGLTNPMGGQRYWYIPILTWLGIVGWLFTHAKSQLIKIISGIALCSFLLIGIPSDWQITPRPNKDFPAYVSRFKAAAQGTKVIIPINPGWEMVLYKK